MDLSVLIVLLVAIIGLILGIISFKTFKNIRKKRVEKSAKLQDFSNIDFLFALDKKSGLIVYKKSYSEKQLNDDEISEILQLIHNLRIELLNVDHKPTAVKLEYKDSILVISDFVNIRYILLMRESPSEDILYFLEEVVYDIYKKAGDIIDNFKGDVKPFSRL